MTRAREPEATTPADDWEGLAFTPEELEALDGVHTSLTQLQDLQRHLVELSRVPTLMAQERQRAQDTEQRLMDMEQRLRTRESQEGALAAKIGQQGATLAVSEASIAEAQARQVRAEDQARQIEATLQTLKTELKESL